MLIGERLRELREAKQLSQSDLEKRTGLLRCYISRVENGHTIPAVETLEKFASALQIPMYQIFYEGENPPELMELPKQRTAGENAFGSTEEDARWLAKLWRLLGQTSESDRKLLLYVANKMARTKAD
jgi:transcriptional regulator with XRE-family HTH domain